MSGIRVYDPVAEERSALAAPQGVVRIGRESDCELVLADDLEISRRHAEVRPGPEALDPSPTSFSAAAPPPAHQGRSANSR